MYQVAWENISGMPMRDYKILETWADVKDWVEIAQHKYSYWTVSMILDGSHKQSQVPDGDLDEKGYWFDNLNKMLPEHLDGSEIVACMFNMASNYIPQEEMGRAFYAMSRMIEDNNKTNGSMH